MIPFRLVFSEVLAGSFFRVSSADTLEDGGSRIFVNVISMPVDMPYIADDWNLEISVTLNAEFVKIQTHTKRFGIGVS
jgi:hypothetical protein